MRYEQIYRIHLTAEALQANRLGMTLDALTEDVGERTGIRTCERTTRRDCEFLELLGLIDHDAGRNLWKWRGTQAAFLFGQGSPDAETLRGEVLALRTTVNQLTRRLYEQAELHRAESVGAA